MFVCWREGSFAIRCSDADVSNSRKFFGMIYVVLEEQVEPRIRLLGRLEAKRLSQSEKEADAAIHLQDGAQDTVSRRAAAARRVPYLGNHFDRWILKLKSEPLSVALSPAAAGSTLQHVRPGESCQVEPRDLLQMWCVLDQPGAFFNYSL